ncbi:MAG: diacylglycerol kinase catalytic region [Streptosporangiaceae bacterium]|nr:diacylglycerol kinase catalytic region [Streptosporangiaceae bacterium]
MRTKDQLETAIRQGGPAVLIVNVRSRRGRRHFDQAVRLLDQAGLTFARVFPVADPERLPEIFGEALDLAPDLIVVGGGDGTVKEAVGHLAERDVALGLLPLGTTNNFARGLELPVKLSRAVAVLRDGKIADVDVGRVHRSSDPQDKAGEVFANMISLGLSVEVAGHVPHGLKRVLGRGAYALTAARLMPSHPPFKATVHLGGRTHDLTTHQLNIANGSHHSGRPIAADAGPDDRLLTVYRLGDEARLKLAAATLRHVLTGHRRSLREDEFINTGDEVFIRTDPPLPVDVDGEIRGETPVRVTLVPNALRVIVPRGFEDN